LLVLRNYSSGLNKEEKLTATKETNNGGIKEEDDSYSKDTLGTKQDFQDGEQKMLGVKRKFAEDRLVFSLHEIATVVRKLEPTKRNTVGISTRFFHPLGFVSPVSIRFKMLFKELCVSKVGWDELLHTWRSLVSTFHDVSISIPRCYFHSNDKLRRCTRQGLLQLAPMRLLSN